MKEVSGNTWVQKAVFLEPKALFSSALTMCSRGWYLCMELRMICGRETQSELQTLPSFILTVGGPRPEPRDVSKHPRKGNGNPAACARDTLLRFLWCGTVSL